MTAPLATADRAEAQRRAVTVSLGTSKFAEIEHVS